MILLFFMDANTNENIRRTDYYYPFMIGVISWKERYVKHEACSATIICKNLFVTANFCLDIYNLGDTSLNRTPSWWQPSNQSNEKETFVYEIYVTLLHPEFNKSIMFDKVNVTINNCLGLAQFDENTYSVSSYAVLKFSYEIHHLVESGYIVPKWNIGWIIRHFYRVELQNEGELIYDKVYMKRCNYSLHQEKFVNISYCATGWWSELQSNESYLFEWYGAPFFYYSIFTGIVYEGPSEGYVTVCSVTENLDWLEEMIETAAWTPNITNTTDLRTNNQSYDVKFSLELSVSD